MSEEWHRLNRQLERERRVRRTRIRIGIIVAAILLFSIGIALMIHRLQNYDGGSVGSTSDGNRSGDDDGFRSGRRCGRDRV